MGKIIQRDFFPDLQKLKAQSEYLEALEKNDIRKLREMHMKYSSSKPQVERSKLIQYKKITEIVIKSYTKFQFQVQQLSKHRQTFTTLEQKKKL